MHTDGLQEHNEGGAVGVRVEVFGCMGYITQDGHLVRTRVWKVEVVGRNNQRWGPEGRAGGWAVADKAAADEMAEKWARFTGWDVVDLGVCPDRDEALQAPECW